LREKSERWLIYGSVAKTATAEAKFSHLYTECEYTVSQKRPPPYILNKSAKNKPVFNFGVHNLEKSFTSDY